MAIGIKKGIVVDIDSTVKSIKMAIDEAELMADTKISNVWQIFQCSFKQF